MKITRLIKKLEQQKEARFNRLDLNHVSDSHTSPSGNDTCNAHADCGAGQMP